MKKIFVGVVAFVFSTMALANSGDNARNSATNEKGNQITSGVMGIATGAALAAQGCTASPPKPMDILMCVTGIGGGIQSIMALNAAGKNTDPSGRPLDTSPDFCASNPDFCNTNVPDPYKDPVVIETLNDFGKLARDQGVDITDPASMQNYLDKHAGDLDGAAGGPSMSLPASAQAKLEKLKKDLQSKYKVSAVALEGGGGGRFHGGSGSGKDAKDFDLSKFLNQNAERGIASTDGLQRRLASGEPVGVASDDIFKLISRKYQTKIGSKTFLNPGR